ncbi:hydroxyproline dehydrogenase isoform X1 [Cololabis saira]|uniref:hydroxyproline dehydrogenase isoform X1 n=1 Tax=Cololabis saira TaxID=129043 RepID=UPI002AD2B88F|nr:hydroxyproline dehydrogenase isoform X1 [Cololabis saira]
MMLCSRLRPSLPGILPLRLLGTTASRAIAVKQPEVLSGTLAFEDPDAFRVKSLGELLRALGVFRLCSIPVLVNNCGKLMSLTRKVLGRRGFSLLLKPTVYAQFVAGETEVEISQSMGKMSFLGLRPMLAVPIEEDLGESTGEKRYEENMETMLECVRMSHCNAWSKDPMVQLKITALLSPELCVKLTTLIAQQPYDLSLLVRALDGEPITFSGLDEKDTAHLLCGLRRLNKVATASEKKVRLLVDAEYTYMNPGLSLVTMAMMKKFNKDGVWIWNTYQCYLKESRSLLLGALRLSESEGFCLGVKLVRGAYMDKERRLAEEEAREDPVHQSWEDTNDSYNGSLDEMLKAISQKPENYRIIVASHNEESVKRAAKRMEELDIDRDGGSVCFGQLFGMCDHVSLTLAKQGYAVYKSVPYGSVDDTLPYLVRRAEENRTVLQGIRKERDLLRKELKQRLGLILKRGS